jgi:hypothetical protein
LVGQSLQGQKGGVNLVGSLQDEGFQALARSHDRRKRLRVTGVPENPLGTDNTDAWQF